MSLPLNLNVAETGHLKCNKTQPWTCRWTQPPHAQLKSMSCKARISDEEEVAEPAETTTNFYKVLFLASENVSFAEIRRAYRSLALQFHPDVCPPSAKDEATKRFLEIQKAYETLSDPISRKLHDCELGTKRMSSKFPKHVWESQLAGLEQRSRVRMERKKKRFGGSFE